MVLSTPQQALVAAIQDGLPLCPRPYAAVARQLGWSEDAVRSGIAALLEAGIIRRLGVVVRHHELGYRANAMVVWDIADDAVDAVGERLGAVDCITLCYRRPRRLPLWPYNLFSMIHGRDQASVRARLEEIRQSLGLTACRHELLFSTRRFKQRGARYAFADQNGARP
jgi:DNA-binding Lrp family transcriptional regulator